MWNAKTISLCLPTQNAWTETTTIILLKLIYFSFLLKMSTFSSIFFFFAKFEGPLSKILIIDFFYFNAFGYVGPYNRVPCDFEYYKRRPPTLNIVHVVRNFVSNGSRLKALLCTRIIELLHFRPFSFSKRIDCFSYTRNLCSRIFRCCCCPSYMVDIYFERRTSLMRLLVWRSNKVW